jgi:hypothetical protein
VLHRHALVLLLCLAPVAAPAASAQQADSSLLTLDRIYGSKEFAPQPFGPARWLEDGTAYTTLEPAADGPGQDLVSYDVE